MFKQMFRFKADPADTEETRGNGSTHEIDPSATPPETAARLQGNVENAVTQPPASRVGEMQSFEEIYRNAPVKPPKVAYSSLGILRVVEMVHSPYLGGMSPESKRNSVMMAIEAVGIKAEDLLQDAMARQRALNDYEESQQARLRSLQAAKAQENALIREELDRLSAAHLGRIQVNLDLITTHEETLRVWTKRKEQESEQIAEAASYCAPQGAAGNTTSLTATVARFGADAVVGKSTEAAAGKR
jgi:hypothetical protein